TVQTVSFTPIRSATLCQFENEGVSRLRQKTSFASNARSPTKTGTSAATPRFLERSIAKPDLESSDNRPEVSGRPYASSNLSHSSPQPRPPVGRSTEKGHSAIR